MTTWSYNVLDQMVQVTLPNPDDGTDSGGPATSYTFTTLGDTASMTDPRGQSGSYDTTYEYDGFDRLDEVVQPSPDGIAAQPTTTFTLDVHGNTLSVTDPNSNTTSETFDSMDRVQSATDAEGNTTYFVSDGDNNVTESYQLDIYSAKTNDVFSYYAGRSQPYQTTDADGNSTYFSYDGNDNLLSETDPLSSITYFSWDHLNRQTGTSGGPDPITYTSYDLDNNLLETIDGNGQEILYGHDDLNRVTSETWVGGGTGGGANNFTIDTNYDADGQVTSTSQTDDGNSAANLSYAYLHDYLGQTTQTTIDYDSSTNVPEVVLAAQFDANGNRTELDATIGGTNDYQNTYIYDRLDNLTELYQHQATSGNTVHSKTVLVHDDTGSRLSEIDRYYVGATMVAKSVYTYTDDLLTELRHSDASNATIDDFTWSNFDTENRVGEFTSSKDGTVDYEYDPAGQLTSADYTALSGHTYYADTATVANESYSPDANGNLSTTQSGPNQVSDDGTWHYTYDLNGNVLTQIADVTPSNPNAVAEIDYSYDFRNHVTKEVEKNEYGYDLAVIDYVLDMYGDLVGRDETDHTYSGSSSTPTGTTTHAQSFVYDGTDLALVFNGSGTLTNRYVEALDQVLADEIVNFPAVDNTIWALPDNQGNDPRHRGAQSAPRTRPSSWITSRTAALGA